MREFVSEGGSKNFAIAAIIWEDVKNQRYVRKANRRTTGSAAARRGTSGRSSCSNRKEQNSRKDQGLEGN